MMVETNISEEMVIEPRNEPFYAWLGGAMRAARRRQNISATELARACDVDERQLELFETGKLAIPVYMLIPAYEFLNRPDEMNKGRF